MKLTAHQRKEIKAKWRIWAYNHGKINGGEPLLDTEDFWIELIESIETPVPKQGIYLNFKE